MGNPSRVAVEVPTVTAEDVCVHYGATVASAPSSLTVPSGQSRRAGRTQRQRQEHAAARPRRAAAADVRHVERRPGAQVAFVAQHQLQHRWMPISVARSCAWAATAHAGCSAACGQTDRRAVSAAAGRMDVRRCCTGRSASCRGAAPAVLVAQALAAEPDLLLLDEPITGLDLRRRSASSRSSATETAAGTAVVLSTHHLGEARRDRSSCCCWPGASWRPAARQVLQRQLLLEAFGNRMVRTARATVVVDEHGHDEDCPDAEPEAAELLPQHDHDHVHHEHGTVSEQPRDWLEPVRPC